MTEHTVMRAAATLALALLSASCVTVDHIQQQPAVRTMKFTGSHKSLAQCIQQRLGGKVRDEAFGDKYVVYDAVKGRQTEGLTHYAVTVGAAGAEQGFAELRVMRPARATGPNQPPPARLTVDAIREYWSPVQECAAQAKARGSTS